MVNPTAADCLCTVERRRETAKSSPMAGFVHNQAGSGAGGYAHAMPLPAEHRGLASASSCLLLHRVLTQTSRLRCEHTVGMSQQRQW